MNFVIGMFRLPFGIIGIIAICIYYFAIFPFEIIFFILLFPIKAIIYSREDLQEDEYVTSFPLLIKVMPKRCVDIWDWIWNK
jgi:hypothetical protein